MADVAYIAVVGPGAEHCSEEQAWLAEDVGARLAEAGAVGVTGGLGGVVEAACRGAKLRRGVTVGVLAGDGRGAANGWVDVVVATGLGEMRNALVVRASDGVVAVGGGLGTLSEVAFALRTGVPVTGLGSFELDGVVVAGAPAEAVERVLGAVAGRSVG